MILPIKTLVLVGLGDIFKAIGALKPPNNYLTKTKVLGGKIMFFQDISRNFDRLNSRCFLQRFSTIYLKGIPKITFLKVSRILELPVQVEPVLDPLTPATRESHLNKAIGGVCKLSDFRNFGVRSFS